MFGFTPLMQRTAVAKTLGFIIGLIGFFFIRAFAPDADPLMAWAFLALYLTIGGVVGVIGSITHMPIFNVPYPPALRGGIMGAWFAILAVLFGYQNLTDLLMQMDFLPSFLQSTVWIIVEAAIIGALLDVIVTRVIGDAVPNAPAE